VSGVTPRSLIIGAALSLLIGVGEPYGAYVIMGTHMGALNGPAAFFLFFVWVGVVQVLLGLIHRKLVLGKGELLTIYIMMVVATAFGGGERNGFCLMLLGSVAGVSYLATPENEWAERVHPYVADWMVPHDELGIQWFFEGMPDGESIPWGMWLPPLLWWLAFMAALWMFSICAMVILRRQWVEHEHLIYPITKVPLAMVESPSVGSRVAPFFKSPLMWVGLLLAFGRESLNALNHYFPFVPVIPNNFGNISLWRGVINFSFYLNLMILGFAYFLKPDVMLGMWVFTLLRHMEEGLLNLAGAGLGEALSNFGGGGGVTGILAHQSIGAMIAMVLFGLWIARGHLRQVFRKAFRGDDSVDDSDEIMSYRTAVWGAILGLVGMSLWLWKAGLPMWAAPLFLFGAMVTFISLTRIIAEAGLPMVFPRNIPLDFVISGIGAKYIGPSGISALGPTVIWTESLQSSMMAHAATGLKLSGEIAYRKRWLLLALAIAIGISSFSTFWMTLWITYREGGINVDGSVSYLPDFTWEYMGRRVEEDAGPNWLGWLIRLLGGGVMAGLILLQRRFLWWPLHPLGFVVSMDRVMGTAWFPVFLAWLIKSVLLKYGGIKAYRTLIPVFYGLIIGQFVAGGFWLIVDYFTGMMGNGLSMMY
jgi:hypothetical protein